jgi:DNA helicase-2/ATP-dependent DNA helicase PcrA
VTTSPSPAEEEPLFAALNPQQREAVLATEGPVLILAGAGSGKTRVITTRLAYLVREKGVQSHQILAVTFTNKAAAEMRERVEKLLPGVALQAWIATFHSFCVRLLRREAASAGLPPGFVIYDEDDQLQAVRAALRALDLSEKLHPPRRVLSRISSAKNARGAAEPFEEDASFGAALTNRIAEHYRQALAKAGALDFDDLLLRAVELLARDAEVRERYRLRFRYVLVDEYQDTNAVQYELVRLLAGPGGNVTVVGDEDQSIYSWRGADIRNILDFEQDFEGARVLRLEQNYRSAQTILDVAAGLVANNLNRKGKTLIATKPGGEPVRLRRCGDEFEEAAFVVERIAATRGRQSAAVLYRMNAQSRLFEEALLRLRIPYVVVGGVGFYERKEVKDVVAYLRLLLHPHEPLALRRILNVPPRGIGERTLLELERLAAARSLTLWEALQAAVDEALFPARAGQPLARFRELIDGLRTSGAAAGVKALIERTLATTGYAAALAQEETQESQDRLENLAELLSAAADYEAREGQPTLAGFLDRVSLLSDHDVAKGQAPVVLMTLHSAKGLEFDSVFLVGLEEGSLPHVRSQGSTEALEEERRLCYVGMTRARERLFLSWAQSRQVFGQRRLNQPSRFLEEIPRERLELTGGSDLPPARRSRPQQGRRGEPAHVPEADLPPTPPGAALRPGARVRHPLFGVGTVLRAEGSGDDLKLTVSFPGAGAKRLVARYAGLELV